MLIYVGSRKMIINWILPEATQCGGIRVALQYANALTEQGHDVICYVPKSGQHFGWKRIFFMKEVLKMHFIPEMRGIWFENKFNFEFPLWISNRSIREADITIATSWITSYWVNELSKEKGKKVYFIQGFETWGTKKTNMFVRESYKLPFDECITVSTALHDRLFSEIGTESKVVCNGVEECFLEYIGEKPLTDIVIGIPYRETRGDDIKNCELGIQVLLEVKERFPFVRLMAFGFNKPLKWDNRIEFWENPSRKELIEFYHKVNIFYVPSLYEGWGLPAMEAMAQECCVLAANSGMIQELGKDRENCIVIQNPRNRKEAVIKISNLINNKKKILEIGKNARKVISRMSISQSAKKFESILLNM